MKKVLFLFLIFVNFSIAQVLNIAVSANAGFALKEVVKEFQKKYKNIKINLIVSSSGKLASQILNGAPYDVFLSADMYYPQILYENKVAKTKPKVYAYGVLVLWSFKIKNLNINSLKTAKKIAIANPKIAPYGKRALEAIHFFKMYKDVKSKLVLGESVSQVNQYIIKKLVDLGFTSKSSIFAYAKKGYWIEIDKNTYSPIEQGIVLISDKKEAKEFFDFVLSEKSKQIFKNYGYEINGK
ncbi:MAG TPA: molybdate ABC transporter substrate-binding protein [Persephonella sp.]|nr:molybdate ABC transporter substrate-binding protein [Hydrogenothermaceae bacterium]HIQ25685.1 molybdate ABC transporter substrate-binding protein [Persephonella sp.]